MKAEVEALVDELKRLRKAGVSRVNVSEDAIRALKQFAKAPQLDEATRTQVLESIPEQVRSANASDFDEVFKASKTEVKKKAVRAGQGAKLPRPPSVTLPEGDKKTRWEALRDMVLNCRVCNQHVKPGKKVVFGVGNIDADIFFCGEAPGADEEIQGEPFVGKAGQLLTKMIQAMGLQREDVYIGNIMNWRPEMPTPTGNRPPTLEEMNFCLPYLKAQVAVVQPKLIVALGATAVKGLLGADSFRSLRDVKGQWQEFEGVPVMPTYHPSYLLRNDTKRDKRAAWEDWLKVMEKAGLPISERQQGFFL
ncbi:uracil-DNA glycosylase family protein [Pelagicoccus sp. SDUM812003]|uniref:uracil-DNA glycosylase n=1 Tax=Pelagicoccus sp. SDUM812003 TaxID=3041267 RepID=UPI00280D109D|nr:uracil-DNA glycosylase family protein [Pelagicoccus sp. SDUM812003]MDQ8202951.1 uracil-DNA glycosylase family protein [Pelagicoccus sp. SDUM812003]